MSRVFLILHSVRSLSHVRVFETPWTAARQASLSITNSQSLLTLMSIESVMPSNHLIPCRPLLLLPSIFPSIRDFPSESILGIRWPNYWSFSFSISPSNEYSGLISFRIEWFALPAVQGTLKESSPTPQFIKSLQKSSALLSSSVTSDSLRPPRTVACQAPLSVEFSRQEYRRGLPFPSPGDLLDPGNALESPAFQVDSLPSEPPGKPP